VNKEASPLPSRCPPVSSHHDSPGGQVSAGIRLMELARAGDGVQILAPPHARCGTSVPTLMPPSQKDGRRKTKSAGTWKTLRNATSFL
uniref:Uncharacterized protein n=1 Tax=Aotus nancymaae TaxID=37293 RepID=A0A2K5F3Z6_AOTNA